MDGLMGYLTGFLLGGVLAFGAWAWIFKDMARRNEELYKKYRDKYLRKIDETIEANQRCVYALDALVGVQNELRKLKAAKAPKSAEAVRVLQAELSEARRRIAELEAT